MLTTLLVDDEPLARARLRRLLEAQHVQVLGEAEDGTAALQLAADLRPDLLFLDIQMPGLTGIQLASALTQLESAPLLVFVTGYSEYALAAFEYAALDYLVKPISPERLEMTLARARERLADKHARDQIRQRPNEPSLPPPPLRSLPVRGDFAVRFIPIKDILCAVAREKRVFIRTREGEARAYDTLTQLEALLPADRFIRIHDSSLINLDAVVELLFLGDHTYEVRLTDGQRLRVGRTRYAELQRRMGLNNRAAP
ncbi:MAG TPA: LytTR family DNA-binding domain-containing protein [Chthonomonadaceae bacterium]|nr:LytTR family DNA-binding domain-containing protein [Chthonomonadaceae bacterium]